MDRARLEWIIDATNKFPVGTVTFMFTDIEGSTRLLQDVGETYGEILEAHNNLMRKAIDRAGGVVVRTEGDSFFAVFEAAPDAVTAAVEAQRSLSDHELLGGERVKVRIGLHTGIGARGGDDYLGIDVHRAARISDAGHGGQILVSAATFELADASFPPGVAAHDLGRHELKDLDEPEHLFRLQVEGISDNPAPPRSVSVILHNLPAQLSSFVGRDTEMAEARSLLHESRLLTLTGPGGTGKTRLALELARQSLSGFADGVFFVPLAGISDPGQVPAKILEALPDHVVDTSTSTEQHLLDYVARRSLLFVIDNFEHVIDAAPFVAKILQASPAAKVLATSRIALRLDGEQELQIPPLSVPDLERQSSADELAAVDAVALFTNRARAARSSFQLTAATAPLIAELVARLDGLPLAIELVASRTRTLALSEIMENLSHVLASGGRRDLPVRQQTMHSTIEWSYALLPEPSKTLMPDLAVFAGGAELAQIREVAGSDLGDMLLEALEILVEHSLVGRSEFGEGARFRMLEVVRQFALGELTEERRAELRERHAHAYADMVAAAEPLLTGSDSAQVLDRLSIEHDNIRIAQQWAVECGHIDMAYAMAASLWRFFHMRGLLSMARGLLANLLEVGGASSEARAKVLEAAGGVAYWSGDMAEARRLYTEALELVRETGDPGSIAHALYNLAFARSYDGDPEQGRALLEEAYGMFEELQDEAGMAAATWGLGDTWTSSGNLVVAREYFEKSIAAFEKLDDPFGLGWALYTNGEILVRLGEHDNARQHLERGMRLFDSRDPSAVVMFLAAFASLAMAEGDHERGARLAGAMAVIRDETGTDLVRVGISTATDIDPESFGLLDGELADIYDEGRAMSLAAAVELALEAPA